MTIGIPRQKAPRERRVGLTPDAVARLDDLGTRALVESGAGAGAGYRDDQFTAVGAELVDGSEAWSANVVVTVRPPDPADLEHMQAGATLIGLLEPLENRAIVDQLASADVTALAFELLPRVTAAQTMDVLSSQATVAGYSAVLTGAERLPRFFPMLTTAAGTIRPATVVVLGAGVAGLQAIATARRLGARVSAFDIRAAAAEQVESLGAHFIDLGVAQQDETRAGGYAQEVEVDEQTRILHALHEHVAKADIVIGTAQIPGRPAPTLITRDMVEAMPAGAVVVDAAAPTGGNCEISVADEDIDHGGVLILAPTDLASRCAGDASRMYARNVEALLRHVWSGDAVELDLADEITAGVCVTHGGAVIHPRVSGETAS